MEFNLSKWEMFHIGRLNIKVNYTINARVNTCSSDRPMTEDVEALEK